MRHIARFYTDESFLCNDSLQRRVPVFFRILESRRFYPNHPPPLIWLFLDRTWLPERIVPVWLPFFGWFGTYPVEIR